MKTHILLSLAVLSVSAVAVAAPVTRTTTHNGVKYDGTRVSVRDKSAGTYSRDTSVTRASDGATATRRYDRTRTATGYVESGTATGLNGQTYTMSGQGTRTETGYVRNRNVKNGEGATVYNRDVAVTRANGQVSRNITHTKAEGFHPPKFGGGRRR